MGSFAEPEELKTLLNTHKDLNQLEDIGELLGISMTYSQHILHSNYTVTYLIPTLFFKFSSRV